MSTERFRKNREFYWLLSKEHEYSWTDKYIKLCETLKTLFPTAEIAFSRYYMSITFTSKEDEAQFVVQANAGLFDI
jgi:hypothetical protein